MKPKRSDFNDSFDRLESPLGVIYLVFSSSVLTGVSFGKPKGIVFKKTAASAAAKKELSEYFGQGRKIFTCTTAFREGTEFEKEVWSKLRNVPYGETKTYKWLAREIGKPQAFRAVGNALAKNPLPIIFPCHRIIESDGTLGGYSSGTDLKRRLLEIEYYTKQSKS